MRGDGSSASDQVKSAAVKLLEYCSRSDWAGWDPYDALNSWLFQKTPLARFHFPRLALTQALKRSPINVRPLLGVPRLQNPKGLALFSTACLRLEKVGLCNRDVTRSLVERLLQVRSKNDLVCWGYHFDWQQRFILVPKYEPNIICTSFGGNALIDFYEATGEVTYLEKAVNAARFLLTGLPIIRDGDALCISYTPLGRSTVHNASLLGAAFLARVHSHAPNIDLIKTAVGAAKYSVNRQRSDGAWPYGEASTQQWIDSFHTGFNLVALRAIQKVSPQPWIDEAIRKGFKFFLEHFFEDGCIAKYYHNQVYPIDIHSIAQAVVTLVEFRDVHPSGMRLAERVLDWAIQHMVSPQGFFYYQQHRFYTNRISYMRWSQAWMLLALATFLEAKEGLDEFALARMVESY